MVPVASLSLVFRWRRLMSEGGKEAVRADEDVVAASEVRWLSGARMSARPKTMEVEILKEALDLARVPTLLSRSQLPEDTP
jgi:transposase